VKTLLLAVALLSVHRTSDDAKKIDVAISSQPFSKAIRAVSMYVPERVELAVGDDPLVTYRANGVAPMAVIRALAAQAKASVVFENGRWWVQDVARDTVTIDVKDAEVHAILKQLQRQCGIKNLVIDPDVQGSGTFLFHDVPCQNAFDVVFHSLGLRAVNYPNSVITVRLSRQ
jgi:hypothetical protein